MAADGHVLFRASEGLPIYFTDGAALLGAIIWEGHGTHPQESVFWLWFVLSLAAAHASVVSAVRMKLGHRAVLYVLNALCIAMLAFVAGVTEHFFSYVFFAAVWLFVLAAIAIPLACRLGGAPAADAGPRSSGSASA